MFSPAEVPEKEPTDLLNKKKCLEYLAALRHAKWFQVNSIRNQSISSNVGRKLIHKWINTNVFVFHDNLWRHVPTGCSPVWSSSGCLEIYVSGFLPPGGRCLDGWEASCHSTFGFCFWSLKQSVHMLHNVFLQRYNIKMYQPPAQ